MSDVHQSLKPEYEIHETGSSGVIRMVVRGFFDPETLHRHFHENRLMVERWRLQGRRIRVLIDAVHLLPHSPEGQAIVQAATASIYREGDKVAVLVSSSLVKMQMRRALSQGDMIDFFISENAANLWLDPRPEMKVVEVAVSVGA